MSIVAAIQMTSTPDVDKNLEEAHFLLEKAAKEGAKLAVLPEMFPFVGGEVRNKIQMKENRNSGKIQTFLSAMAKQYDLWIVGGTIPLATQNENKIRAACLVFDGSGKEVARYDKINLFDAQVSEKSAYHESETVEPGDTTVVIDTPVGKLGLCVCYDIRFPLLMDELMAKGAEIIAIPAAFTRETGKAHWELLMRCRAIDTFCYLIGACQVGKNSPTRETHGHSMIVDPWGTIITEAIAEEPCVLTAHIDLEHLYRVRKRLSASLRHKV